MCTSVILVSLSVLDDFFFLIEVRLNLVNDTLFLGNCQFVTLDRSLKGLYCHR